MDVPRFTPPADSVDRLARSIRRLRLGLAAATIALAASWIGPALRVSANAKPGPTPTAQAEEINAQVQTQLRLAKKALALLANSRQIGAPVAASSREQYSWSRRQLECEVFLTFRADEPRTQDVEVYLNRAKGPSDPARRAALEGHVARMKDLEARYRRLYETQQFSAFDFAQVEYSRMEAEVWLAREKALGEPDAKPPR